MCYLAFRARLCVRVVVSFLSVFGDIKAFEFFLLRYAHSHYRLQDKEQSSREYKREYVDSDHADELRHKVSSAEYSNCKSTPDSAYAVYRDCSDWIVDLDFVEEDNRKDYQYSANCSHKHRFEHRYRIRSRSDTDEACEKAIQSHGKIWFLKNNPRDQN